MSPPLFVPLVLTSQVHAKEMTFQVLHGNGSPCRSILMSFLSPARLKTHHPQKLLSQEIVSERKSAWGQRDVLAHLSESYLP
eukprot:2618446-Amphidinium_carterae.1